MTKKGENSTLHQVDTDSLTKQAIKAAVNKQWYKAVGLNDQILKLEPGNLETLNRQGRAYLTIGDKQTAKRYFLKALKVDPENPLAKRNLELLKNRAAKDLGEGIPSQIFIKEPGRTLTVNFATKNLRLLKKFSPGDRLKLTINKKEIQVQDEKGNILAVNTELSPKLVRLASRVKIEALLVGVHKEATTVLLKASAPVFKQEIDYRPFVRPTDFEEESPEGDSPEDFPAPGETEE